MTTIHLARDLGHVIDDLLERSTQTATAELSARDLTLCDLRVLRTLDRKPGGDYLSAIAARLGVPAGDARRSLVSLRHRGLATGASTGLVALTRRGHALANELERARRNELELFIDELPYAERLRLEAAVHLLTGDLSGRLAAA
jgi:DNA-binding MarR family transcriptional regulator